jgi:release factor glutamine methyltransferase
MIADTIQSIKNELSCIYHNDLLLEQYAWWILEAITGKNKTQLLIAPHSTLNVKQQQKLTAWITQIKTTQIPLAYLIGNVPFNGLTIEVEPPVLIPRPETEEWVLTLIDQLKRCSAQPLTILDLCTGSGCIALALAQAFPLAQLVATDISEQALDLAQRNAQNNNIHNVQFVKSDLFSHVGSWAPFDLIVANPPYIALSERDSLDVSVSRWEDPHALFAPDDGLAIIKQIIDQSPAYLKTNKELYSSGINQLYIEIGYQQGPIVKQYFEQQSWRLSTIHKDLEKNDRVVSGSL